MRLTEVAAHISRDTPQDVRGVLEFDAPTNYVNHDFTKC